MNAAADPLRVTADRLAVRVPAGTVAVVRVIDLGGAAGPATEELSAGSWGNVGPDPGRDIAKVAVIDPATGTVRVGFARGLGVQAGAIAVRVVAEGGRLVVAGTSDRECAAAASAVVQEDLAVAVTVGARVVARDEAAAETVLRDLGSRLTSPFGALAGVRPEDLTPNAGPSGGPGPPAR